MQELPSLQPYMLHPNAQSKAASSPTHTAGPTKTQSVIGHAQTNQHPPSCTQLPIENLETAPGRAKKSNQAPEALTAPIVPEGTRLAAETKRAIWRAHVDLHVLSLPEPDALFRGCCITTPEEAPTSCTISTTFKVSKKPTLWYARLPSEWATKFQKAGWAG